MTTSKTSEGCVSMDKRIPIAVLVVLLLQFGGCVWWASDISARVSGVERKQTEYQALNARLQSMEIKLEGMGTDMRWIRQSLENGRN